MNLLIYPEVILVMEVLQEEQIVWKRIRNEEENCTHYLKEDWLMEASS